KKSGKRWVKPEEEAAAKLEAEQQRRADKVWRPRLERIRKGIDSADTAQNTWAQGALSQVTDPRALPMIWAVFVTGGSERSQIAAAQLFGQIDGPRASVALATTAILSPEGAPRARAIDTLIRRDPREIVGRLIAMVRKPFTYKVRPIYG